MLFKDLLIYSQRHSIVAIQHFQNHGFTPNQEINGMNAIKVFPVWYSAWFTGLHRFRGLFSFRGQIPIEISVSRLFNWMVQKCHTLEFLESIAILTVLL